MVLEIARVCVYLGLASAGVFAVHSNVERPLFHRRNRVVPRQNFKRLNRMIKRLSPRKVPKFLQKVKKNARTASSPFIPATTWLADELAQTTGGLEDLTNRCCEKYRQVTLFSHLQSWLIATGPAAGLLGTALGLAQLKDSNVETMTAVAHCTTSLIAGVVVGLIASIGNYYNTSRAEPLCQQIEDFVEVLDTVQDRNHERNIRTTHQGRVESPAPGPVSNFLGWGLRSKSASSASLGRTRVGGGHSHGLVWCFIDLFLTLLILVLVGTPLMRVKKDQVPTLQVVLHEDGKNVLPNPGAGNLLSLDAEGKFRWKDTQVSLRTLTDRIAAETKPGDSVTMLVEPGAPAIPLMNLQFALAKANLADRKLHMLNRQEQVDQAGKERKATQ